MSDAPTIASIQLVRRSLPGRLDRWGSDGPLIDSMVALDGSTARVDGRATRIRGVIGGIMDSTPPRPPNLSELSEMGERAKERMVAQRAAADVEAARRASSAGGAGIGSWIETLFRRLRGR